MVVAIINFIMGSTALVTMNRGLFKYIAKRNAKSTLTIESDQIQKPLTTFCYIIPNYKEDEEVVASTV